MKQLAEPFMGFLLLFLVFLVSRYGTEQVLSEQALAGLKQPKQPKQPVVVVDAGHGGNDPGKVAVNGSLEKDINLAIAKRLAWYLEQADVTVIMTRDSDSGLYSPTDSRKKTSDMERRCQIMNESKADLAVSIHQNSYHDEEISGGQVFYYADSAPGKRLAERIQKRFDYVLGAENRRQPKANESYYLLLHAECPAVIVECGFLSNWREASLLGDEEYQDRMAYTIHMGILEYLNGE